MTWLVEEIRRRVAEQEPQVILQKMGYKADNENAHARLRHVVADDVLGLGDSGFDFRYDGRGFVRALCGALNINGDKVKQDIKALEQVCYEDRKAFRAYLFVDTGFRRTSQPVFALAICEQWRNLPLPVRIRRLSLPDQLAIIRTHIHEHMASCGGTLRMWGDVQRYLYYYADNAALAFSPQGELIGEHLRQPDRARMARV